MSDDVVSAFVAELAEWRAAHPGWTETQQLRAFGPADLWRRAGGRVIDLDTGDYVEVDRDLYRGLMMAAGYIVSRRPGDDGNLPCGWPVRQER